MQEVVFNKQGLKMGFLGVLGIVFLTGCASTKGPSTVNSLQIQVARLERSVDDQNRTIEQMRYQIDSLARQVSDTDVYDDQMEMIEEPVRKSSESSSATGKGSDYSKENQDILRVDVSAKAVQSALKEAGYYNGSIDGKLGSASQTAIKQFQKDNGLKADGIIGRQTWQELKAFSK